MMTIERLPETWLPDIYVGVLQKLLLTEIV